MNRQASGFTLLEVLVALGIVAVISILSWQGLQEVLRSANRVSEVDEQVQATAAVFGQLDKDLAALELNSKNAGPNADFVEISSQGIILQATQRKTSQPAYRERVEWLLDGNRLIRIARNELNPDQASTGLPVPMAGLQIRLLMEPGGWTNPTTFGNYSPQERNDLELQGPASQAVASNAPPPPSGPDGVDTGQPNPAAPQQAAQQAMQNMVRAVEISLTQPNNQTVTRVLLTGGVY